MEVFLDMKEHQLNIDLYINSGGDAKIAKRYTSPTLQNQSKIKYLLSKLDVKKPASNKVHLSENLPKKENTPVVPPKIDEKHKFLGLITQYPVQLHKAYNEAFSLWIQLCSLKLQLNLISADDVTSAFQIQTDMVNLVHRFDRLKSALDHYMEFKEVIPTESYRDYTKLSPLELDKERRNLASLICKRKKTLLKKQSELPDKSSALFHKRLEAFNKKKRELEELILAEEKIMQILSSK